MTFWRCSKGPLLATIAFGKDNLIISHAKEGNRIEAVLLQ